MYETPSLIKVFHDFGEIVCLLHYYSFTSQLFTL